MLKKINAMYEEFRRRSFFATKTKKFFQMSRLNAQNEKGQELCPWPDSKLNADSHSYLNLLILNSRNRYVEFWIRRIIAEFHFVYAIL